MQVIFIHGSPASGKYTIGVKLSELTGLPLFHNHLAVDTAKSLFSFGTPSFNKIRSTIWRTAFTEAALAKKSFIFTFSPEATVDPALIAEISKTVQSAGGELHFVQIVCSHETILKRIGNSSRARFGKLIDVGLFKSIEALGAFEFPPLPPPLLIIDTDEHTAGAAAELIARAIASSKDDA
jgi:hypothetical protein